ELGPPDDLLLYLDGKRVPPLQVMKVLLHDDVATAGKRRVLIADDGGVDRGLVRGVLRPIDEAEQVPLIEVLEAVHFVRRGNCATEPGHDLDRELEAQVHTDGANMEEDVAGSGDGMMPAANLTEWMQFFRPRRPEEPLPGIGAKCHDARQAALEVAEAHRAHE